MRSFYQAQQTLKSLAWIPTLVPLSQAFSDVTRGTPISAAGTFANPAANVRPRFRYWLPDASVDADTVAADIAAAGSIGAGGVEFVPFFEYGGALGSMPAGADWAAYNFGTAAFRDVFAAALTAHEQNGLLMDFALGPNQGQGVPASPDDPGLQWDLVPFTAAVPENASFAGTIPGWGAGELVSMVSALVTSNSTITYEAAGQVGVQNVTYDQYVLASDSLLDQTDEVSTDGFFEMSLPRKEDGQHYRLFAFYQRLSGNKNLQFTNNVTTGSIFDNGSYVVDHFDPKGAETVIHFWEEHILVDGIRERLQRVGHYAWEDSPELLANITWSRSLPTRFQELFDYDIKPFLPLLTFQQNNLGVQPTEPGAFQCILDTEDQGVRYVNDFRKALVAGYREYVETLTAWVHGMGLQFSVQPAYGLPMDMQAAIPDVDVPECESLTFLDSIDSYRQFVCPANLADKRVISNELGAVRGSAFRYHLPELLFSANRGFAAGVNQYVIHGQSYSGSYYQTTWPGHVPFNYLFSEAWSPRQPVWEHGFEEALNYMARVEHVQQSGVPKVDVAIYNKESATTIRTVYSSSDLIEQGWSYNYLASENLNSTQAIVENGVLAPAGASWKALAIQSNSNLTLDAIASLQSFVKSGLPIIFVGGSPGFYPTGADTNIAAFEEQLSALQLSEGSYTVDEGQLANQLFALGLSPRVAVATNGTWYTTWRETDDAGYALIYADLIGSSGNVTIADTRTPFFLNPWTGEETPVLIYEQDAAHTIIPLDLAGNQTVIISFSNAKDQSVMPPYHVSSAPSGVVGASFDSEQGLALHVSAATKVGGAVLSNNVTCALSGSGVPEAFELTEWELVAEHWEAPDNISDASQPTKKFNTTHSLPSLSSWTDIPALVNSSGIGYYTSTFIWPGNATNTTMSALGAYISYDNVLHSLRVQINGAQLPPLDITHATADISSYLRPGNNTVTAVVPTTWWNYLRTILDTLESSGAHPLPLVLSELLGTPLPAAGDEGLMPGVRVTPFRRVVC